MRFGSATEANRMQKPTSDDNRRGVTRGGEAPKALTGIPGLDEITRGGLPRGRPTLVCGGPGSGKTLLALTFLVNGALLFDEPGVLMTFEENEEEIASDVASLGFDLPGLIDGAEARGRLRARRTQRDRGNRRVRSGRVVRPARLRDSDAGSQAGRPRYHRIAVCRPDERRHPPVRIAAAVPVAERPGSHGADHRRTWRRRPHPAGTRGVRLGRGHPARPPRPRSGLDPPPACGQVSRLPPRHQRVSVPHRRRRDQRAAGLLAGAATWSAAGTGLVGRRPPRRHAQRRGLLPRQHDSRLRHRRHRENEPRRAFSRRRVPARRTLPVLSLRRVAPAAAAQHALDRHRPRTLGGRLDCCSSMRTGRRDTGSRPTSSPCTTSWRTSSRR